MVVHATKGVVPTAPGVDSRTDRTEPHAADDKPHSHHHQPAPLEEMSLACFRSLSHYSIQALMAYGVGIVAYGSSQVMVRLFRSRTQQF